MKSEREGNEVSDASLSLLFPPPTKSSNKVYEILTDSSTDGGLKKQERRGKTSALSSLRRAKRSPALTFAKI